MKTRVKLERVNIFLSAEEKQFYFDIAEKNEQSMTWILRKVLKNYFDYCKEKNVKNGSLKEINKTLSKINYHDDLIVEEKNSESIGEKIEDLNESNMNIEYSKVDNEIDKMNWKI